MTSISSDVLNLLQERRALTLEQEEIFVARDHRRSRSVLEEENPAIFLEPKWTAEDIDQKGPKCERSFRRFQDRKAFRRVVERLRLLRTDVRRQAADAQQTLTRIANNESPLVHCTDALAPEAGGAKRSQEISPLGHPTGSSTRAGGSSSPSTSRGRTTSSALVSAAKSALTLCGPVNAQPRGHSTPATANASALDAVTGFLAPASRPSRISDREAKVKIQDLEALQLSVAQQMEQRIAMLEAQITQASSSTSPQADSRTSRGRVSAFRFEPGTRGSGAGATKSSSSLQARVLSLKSAGQKLEFVAEQACVFDGKNHASQDGAGTRPEDHADGRSPANGDSTGLLTRQDSLSSLIRRDSTGPGDFDGSPPGYVEDTDEADPPYKRMRQRDAVSFARNQRAALVGKVDLYLAEMASAREMDAALAAEGRASETTTSAKMKQQEVAAADIAGAHSSSSAEEQVLSARQRSGEVEKVVNKNGTTEGLFPIHNYTSASRRTPVDEEISDLHTKVYDVLNDALRKDQTSSGMSGFSKAMRPPTVTGSRAQAFVKEASSSAAGDASRTIAPSLKTDFRDEKQTATTAELQHRLQHCTKLLKQLDVEISKTLSPTIAALKESSRENTRMMLANCDKIIAKRSGRGDRAPRKILLPSSGADDAVVLRALEGRAAGRNKGSR
ncbi:unnamed protein product [Amoebophrya sp. A120]|nr:unnamed protein product [Amoebophrya sp. A120]|eukprot:GSA120T00003961001.1